jgi:hypothetical protein
LRHAAQTIRVLHARIVVEVRLANLAVAQQFAKMRGDGDLARMRPRVVNAFVERDGSAEVASSRLGGDSREIPGRAAASSP